MADERSTDIHELSGRSPEFQTELAKQLEELVPEAITDGKVDVAKLKELLAEDVGDTNERFGLFWPGKRRAMRAAQDPTTATLKPVKELSKEWDTTQNIFIEGDNLEVLKVLQKEYHNSIKMIYIDPPYNTGKDFVYPDNFKEGLQNYLEFSKQVDEGDKKISTNVETAGRYHSNWLNMIYPRLKLARNLLTDDGVIFISIDDAEVGNLRKVCDEIFNESNFVAQFIWHSSTGGGLRSKYANDSHQYVLCYVRDTNKAPIFWAPLSDEAIKMYNQEDEKGRYRDKDFAWKNSSAGVNQKYPITAPDGEVILPKSGYIYRFISERFKEELAAGNVTFKKTSAGPFIKEDGSQASWNIYIKKYLFDGKGAPTTLIPRSLVGINNEGTIEVQNLFGARYFESPKNVRLIDYLLQIGSHKESTILDFFSGSGTTAHAVMRLNAEDGGTRKHIQVQLPEPTDEKSEAYKAGYRKISDIARARIDKAGKVIKEKFADKLTDREAPLDIGYRAYKLIDTNFRKWQSRATNDLGELQARLDLMRESADDNASEDDLLVEVMLKMGLPLTSHTEQRDVAGLHVHQVVYSDKDEHADVQPAFYLNEHIKPTLEQLRTIVTELSPSKFVILDDAFKGDNELKTNLVQTCKSYDVELWTV